MAGALAIPAPRNPRYRSLDLWRGLACLLVVMFHASGVAFLSLEASGTAATDPLGMALLAITRIGWVGVPFFFVISGYAISATADVFRRRSGGAGSYFKRRFKRIYPPYWAMLVLQLVIVFAIDVALFPALLTGSIAPIERPWTFSSSQWLGNATLTESWRHTALPGTAPRDYILGQAWTLCYEEQFYIVTGLALLLRPARFFTTAILVTAVSAVIPLLGIRVSGFFFDGYWLAFAAGILVYWQVNYGSARTRPAAWLLLAAGVAYALFVLPGRGVLDRDLVGAMAFAAFLLGVHHWDVRIATSRALRPLAFAGTICYSLYLSHAVIVRTTSQLFWDAGITSPLATLAITIPVSMALAVLVGWLFWYGVERHFLNRPSVAGAPSGKTGEAPVAEPVATPAA
jgi:peptidoglycan/LPS O-acetylase OafA/YrhL